MTIRTDLSSTRITTEPMVGRATAAPGDRAFRSTLRDGAVVLLGGVEAAARALPGGEIVAAAIEGGVRAGSAGGSSSSAGGSSSSAASALAGESGLAGVDPLAGSSDQAMELIMLQQQMQEENRRYSTLSNVLKARHETAKNAIGNIR